MTGDRPSNNVRWAGGAREDLLQIVAWIAKESPREARRVLRRLEERAARLETLSARGRTVPELSRLGVTAFRELVVDPWRLIYRIDESASEIWVVALLDGRRDLDDVLFQRLVRRRT
jgi:toxin ParE1/3/4